MTPALEAEKLHCRSSCVLVEVLDSFEAAVKCDGHAEAPTHGRLNLVDGDRRALPSSPRGGRMIDTGHALATRTGGCEAGSDLASEERMTPGHDGVVQIRGAAVQDRRDGWGSAAQMGEVQLDAGCRPGRFLDDDDGLKLEGAAADWW